MLIPWSLTHISPKSFGGVPVAVHIGTTNVAGEGIEGIGLVFLHSLRTYFRRVVESQSALKSIVPPM